MTVCQILTGADQVGVKTQGFPMMFLQFSPDLRLHPGDSLEGEIQGCALGSTR